MRGMNGSLNIVVRDALEADMGAARNIYARHVLSGVASIEESPPALDEMLSRRRATLSRGMPWLVAEAGGEILGYGYCSPFHVRSAYRFAIEDSIYVAQDRLGEGVGSALLGALIARCEAGPWRQIVAIIGDSGNAGSIGLHRKFGFQHEGTVRSLGFKLGRWLDVVYMRRALGEGDGSAPVAPDGEAH
jgi:phosphinothricin acetyltransferase